MTRETEGEELDEYERDRFTADHDDKAGREFSIDDDIVEETSVRESTDGNELDERGVYQTRSVSTASQERDGKGRFTAEEE
jgi:hypothetical protein